MVVTLQFHPPLSTRHGAAIPTVKREDPRRVMIASHPRRRRDSPGLNLADAYQRDMAVLIAYFNPIGYMRTTMNVLYIINKLRRDGIPVFVAGSYNKIFSSFFFSSLSEFHFLDVILVLQEVSLQGKEFTLAPEQRQLSIKTDSILFYKVRKRN